MSYEFYKVLHLLGVIMLCASLGGFAAFWIFTDKQTHRPVYRALAFTHGFSLLFLLVAGFGLLARLGLAGEGLPTWIYGKLVLWVCAGGIIVLLKKRVFGLLGSLGLISGLGLAAVLLAVFKP